MPKTLATVALDGQIGGTVFAVIGVFAAPVEPRHRFSILPKRDGVCSQQKRLRRAQQPYQHQDVGYDRRQQKPWLAASMDSMDLREQGEPQIRRYSPADVS